MEKFRRPRKVNVLGETYKIFYVDMNSDEYADYEADGLSGHTSRTIQVHNGYDKEGTYRVLRHEIMHGVLAVSGVAEHLTEDQIEMLCVLMETAWKSLTLGETK